MSEPRICAAADCDEPIVDRRSDALYHDDACRGRQWRTEHGLSVPSRFQTGKRADLRDVAQGFWAGYRAIRRRDLRTTWPRAEGERQRVAVEKRETTGRGDTAP